MKAGARAFRSAAAFRAWLSQNHAAETELVVRCFKVHVASKGVTYVQALDEALCYGWIDGVRHAFDAESFTVRFTPRKPNSIWSRVNLAKIEVLIAAGRMAKPGLARFHARNKARTGLYSFERAAMRLAPAFEKQFQAAKAAWAFYEAQPPGYRKVTTFWVMNAKQADTRASRLARLIETSARGKRLL